MQKVRAHNLSISIDGYLAGPDQTEENPIGQGGRGLHEWAFATRTYQAMFGNEGGGSGLDDDFAAQGALGIGATVMGRNMFAPTRGPWEEVPWDGWWGADPPFHHDVFVLTHHERRPLEMEGGTTFHFVTEGPRVALDRALEAADGGDVRIGGGASTVGQYLAEGLIDELHFVIVPILLGRGERLFADGVVPGDTYAITELVSSASVVHARLERIPTPEQ